MARAAEAKGKLRIGDDWNAIRIIALSQSNPLKAIAELVENSILWIHAAIPQWRGNQFSSCNRSVLEVFAADRACIIQRERID